LLSISFGSALAFDAFSLAVSSAIPIEPELALPMPGWLFLTLDLGAAQGMKRELQEKLAVALENFAVEVLEPESVKGGSANCPATQSRADRGPKARQAN